LILLTLQGDSGPVYAPPVRGFPTILAFFALCTACGESGGGPSDGAPDGASAGPDAAACGAASPRLGVYTDTLEIAGDARTYLVSAPADYQPDQPYPLVFAWHGRTSNPEQARSYFGIEAAAADAAIVVYPAGLPVTGDPADTGWDLSATGIDVAFFDALLGRLSGEYCVDTARVFSTGHSFGGYLSNVLGCVRGDDLRAIAPVAGGGPYGGCSGSVAVWVAHGSTDSVVPIAEGQGSRDHWVGANGCGEPATPVEPSPCVAYPGCGEPVVWCEHDDTSFGGHGWPAFLPGGIWSFFAAQP
jgi:polyhydroxybutyrate depolymerase